MIEDQFQRPLQDLRISVTDRCNFRCTYCMPAHIYGEHYQFLPHKDLLSYEEIARLAGVFATLGVRKLRLTGGEPLVRQDLDQLVALLSHIPQIEDIALTTNGYYLPKYAQALKDAGLKRITVSLDTLDQDIFRTMNGGRSDVQAVVDGIHSASQVGLNPIKINCVVQKGVNEHTLVDLARFCKDHGYTLRFIEYMDVGTRNGWKADQVVPYQQIVDQIHAVFPLEAVNAEYFGEVAYRYRYQDGSGEIGMIASVTKPFCGSCTRLRLSPEGQIYTCLFATKGISLRDPLRDGASDSEIAEIIQRVWHQRTDRYSEIRAHASQEAKKIEMYYIGG